MCVVHVIKLALKNHSYAVNVLLRFQISSSVNKKNKYIMILHVLIFGTQSRAHTRIIYGMSYSQL